MPVLSAWLAETEKKYASGELMPPDIIGHNSNKKRRRRTTFSTEEQDVLNKFFKETTMHPRTYQVKELAEQINREPERVRIWFCNRRQAIKKVMTDLKSCENDSQKMDQQNSDNYDSNENQ